MLFGDWRDDQTGVQESEILAEGLEFGVATTNFKVLERRVSFRCSSIFHTFRERDMCSWEQRDLELPNIPWSS